MPEENYREYKLENGLLVALQNTPTETISGRLRVFCGGVHERRGEEGLAHFLEHTLMFGGGKKYSPDEVNELLNWFGYINASKSSSETSFAVDILAEDLELYLDFISDAVFSPRFVKKVIDQERQAVLREISDRKGDAGFKDFEDYMNALYGKGSPYAYLFDGVEGVIGNATPDDLLAFHKKWYSPNNADLIFVGGLPNNVEELIAKSFGGIPRGEGEKYNFPRNQQLKEKVIFHRSAPYLINKDYPEESSAYLVMSFTAPPLKSEDTFTVSVLNYILGGAPNSRLFSRLRSDMGVVYDINSSYLYPDNSGIINIQGPVSSVRVNEAIDAIFDEMEILKSEPISVDELNVIKRVVRYNAVKRLEKNSGRVELIETKLDTGMTLESQMQKINEVTSEAIREAANKYFPENRENGKYILLLRDPLLKQSQSEHNTNAGEE